MSQDSAFRLRSASVRSPPRTLVCLLVAAGLVTVGFATPAAANPRDDAIDAAEVVYGPGDPVRDEGDPLLEETGVAPTEVGGTPHASCLVVTGATALNEPCGDQQDVHSPTLRQCAGPAPTVEGAQTDPDKPRADIEVELLNGFQDADPHEGLPRVSGTVLFDLRITGEHADEADAVRFGVAENLPWPADVGACKAPLTNAGAAYEYQRTDRSPEDGWDVAFNTEWYPDGVYGLALRVLDAPCPDATDPCLAANTLAVAYTNLRLETYANAGGWSQNFFHHHTGPHADPGEQPDRTPPHGVFYDAEEFSAHYEGSADERTCESYAIEYDEPLNNGAAFKSASPNDWGLEVRGAYPIVTDGPERAWDLQGNIGKTMGPRVCLMKPSYPVQVTAQDTAGNKETLRMCLQEDPSLELVIDYFDEGGPCT